MIIVEGIGQRCGCGGFFGLPPHLYACIGHALDAGMVRDNGVLGQYIPVVNLTIHFEEISYSPFKVQQ